MRELYLLLWANWTLSFFPYFVFSIFTSVFWTILPFVSMFLFLFTFVSQFFTILRIFVYFWRFTYFASLRIKKALRILYFCAYICSEFSTFVCCTYLHIKHQFSTTKNPGLIKHRIKDTNRHAFHNNPNSNDLNQIQNANQMYAYDTNCVSVIMEFGRPWH